jgi:hypothetical protein
VSWKSLLIAMALGGLLSEQLAIAQSQSQRHPQPQLITEMDGLLQSKSSMMRRIKAWFPDAYADFVEQLASSGEVPSETAIMEMANQLVSRIRRDKADFVRQASDGQLKSLVRADQLMHETVLEKYGPVTCAEFALSGVNSLTREQAVGIRYVLRMRGNLMLDAIREGVQSNKSLAEPSPQDWRLLIDYWYSIGGSEAKLEALTDRQNVSPDLCELSISFSDAIHELSGEPGQRIRAEIAVEAARD